MRRSETAESRLISVADRALGVLWRGVPAVSGDPRESLQRRWIQTRLQYDEVDRRLMDTFPASDAVARY
jgi:hypothetical protein